MNGMEWVVTQPDHGRTDYVGTVKGFALFWCRLCDRLIAMGAQDGDKGLIVLRQGEPMAKHHGATVDWLRFDGVDVRRVEPEG